VENLRVTNGSKIIHDYFNHFFWRSFEVDFRAAKNVAKTLGVVVPDFKYSESISSLGDRLCDIGSCENIRLKLLASKNYEKINNPDSPLHESVPYNTIQQDEPIPYKPIKDDHGLNREAFSIWKEHYKFFNNNKNMQNILYIVEKVYHHTMWVGAVHGKRNIDHGVCSGLIILQALTFFHELVWGFDRLND
jgi:hypothetical protein